ncbi:peptidylprolyl isomerase [Vibrio sp. 1-Bac 57]
MKYITALILLVSSHFALAAENPVVIIDTNKGQISVELYPEQAPLSVANFLSYVQQDGFKGTIFHRVIKDFMIQGGGFLKDGNPLQTLPAIRNESGNGLSNERGTIAMARTGAPHSATRQFFINHKDNTFLDMRGSQWGYAVFGKVSKGLDVVDAIASVQTAAADKPVQAVIINSITLVKPAAKE